MSKSFRLPPEIHIVKHSKGWIEIDRYEHLDAEHHDDICRLRFWLELRLRIFVALARKLYYATGEVDMCVHNSNGRIIKRYKL